MSELSAPHTWKAPSHDPLCRQQHWEGGDCFDCRLIAKVRADERERNISRSALAKKLRGEIVWKAEDIEAAARRPRAQPRPRRADQGRLRADRMMCDCGLFNLGGQRVRIVRGIGREGVHRPGPLNCYVRVGIAFHRLPSMTTFDTPNGPGIRGA
jgi:hypothetical protein